MRKTLICSLIGLVGCTWMAGCQDKPDGAQTIIIELADPSDQVEETKEEMPEESVSESDTEMETGETQSEEMPEIIGFEENVEFAYKQVSSNDPIIGLLLENVKGLRDHRRAGISKWGKSYSNRGDYIYFEC